jgi:hypothetical protein
MCRDDNDDGRCSSQVGGIDCWSTGEVDARLRRNSYSAHKGQKELKPQATLDCWSAAGAGLSFPTALETQQGNSSRRKIKQTPAVKALR